MQPDSIKYYPVLAQVLVPYAEIFYRVAVISSPVQITDENFSPDRAFERFFLKYNGPTFKPRDFGLCGDDGPEELRKAISRARDAGQQWLYLKALKRTSSDEQVVWKLVEVTIRVGVHVTPTTKKQVWVSDDTAK